MSSKEDNQEVSLKRSDFNDFVEGDIICVTYKKMVAINQTNIIFREVNDSDEILFYPLSIEGYRQAQYEAGTIPTGFFKKDDYKISIRSLSGVFELDQTTLTGAEKDYAELILAII